MVKLQFVLDSTVCKKEKKNSRRRIKEKYKNECTMIAIPLFVNMK